MGPGDRLARRAIRYAVSAGVLTAARLRERTADAARQRVDLHDVLTAAERIHLLLVMKALGPMATRADAIAVVQRQAGSTP